MKLSNNISKTIFFLNNIFSSLLNSLFSWKIINQFINMFVKFQTTEYRICLFDMSIHYNVSHHVICASYINTHLYDVIFVELCFIFVTIFLSIMIRYNIIFLIILVYYTWHNLLYIKNYLCTYSASRKKHLSKILYALCLNFALCYYFLIMYFHTPIIILNQE